MRDTLITRQDMSVRTDKELVLILMRHRNAIMYGKFSFGCSTLKVTNYALARLAIRCAVIRVELARRGSAIGTRRDLATVAKLGKV